MKLTGRIAIVSGAAQGLGQAFAEFLRDQGAQVVAFDSNQAVLELTNMHTMVADVTRQADVEQVVDQAAALGNISMLINNAGNWRATPVDSDWEQALADWDYIMNTNLKGVLMLSRAVVPHLQRAGGGDIVNIANHYVLPTEEAGTNSPYADIYNTSKWALNGFTDAWSKYLARDNIRVNALCMGAVDTPMLRAAFPNQAIPDNFPVLRTEDITKLLLDLLEDGRSGENIGAWPGRPVTLGPIKPIHKRITG